MDRKTKKKLEVLRKKVGHIEQLLAAAKQQMDDPADVTRLQSELEAVRALVKELKAS